MRAHRVICVALCVAFSACGEKDPVAVEQVVAPIRPNILLITADDLGFADLGSYGSEIETPNLDRLAHAGIRLTNFHAASTCSPSRAMLLTGVDSHLVGLGNMAEEMAPNQKDLPGYEGYLNARGLTLASRLKDAGYRTYISGKWHLGNGAGGPSERGFDRSFILEGAASHFDDMRPAYAPTPDAKAPYWEDGVRLTVLPARFDYSSQFYVDRLIEYMEEDRSNDHASKPFFAFLSFTAPHWPLQAPDAAMEKYRGRYDLGYDLVAEARLGRLKELGLIPASASRSERSPKERPWDTLSDEEKRIEARAMEVYAAMVDELDAHTGRLIAYLESRNLMENTLVVFLSDNGAEGHDLDETWPREAFPEIRETIDESHDFSFDGMGRPGSYLLYGPNWANVGAPSFKLHKAFPTEGGTRVPAFFYFPRRFPTPRVLNEFISIKDLAPTLLELAGLPIAPMDPRSDIEPMTGVSAVPLLTLDDYTRLTNQPSLARRQSRNRVFAQELMGKRSVRLGHWKLVHMPAPYGTGDWQLYNLESDLAESNDVAELYPDKVDELEQHWLDYAKDNNVMLPDWVSGY